MAHAIVHDDPNKWRTLLGYVGKQPPMRDDHPIATIDFNDDATADEVHSVLQAIRTLENHDLIAFEQNHTGAYTIARKDE